MSIVHTTTAIDVQIITDREAEWQLRIEMVENARHFLILTTYYFGGDDRSARMADALLDAARRNVRVVLVIDSFGQRLSLNLTPASAHPKLVKRLRDLEAAGGLVLYYSPRSLRHRLIGGGLHVKIQVSEAGVALFGSSNIGHHSFSEWNEVSLRLEGEIVARLLADACRFARIGEAETAKFTGVLAGHGSSGRICKLRYVCEDPVERSGAFFPFGELRNVLTEQLTQLISRARHSLCIASLYFKPAPKLLDSILAACRRGVVVEIFHSNRNSVGSTQIPWISASFQYRVLLKAGARIYENRAGEHSKVILVDDCEAAFGSYNFEHAAHDRLVEAMIFSEDEKLCQSFHSLFQKLRASPDNTPLAENWLSKLPLQLRLKRWFSWPLQRWM